MPNQNSSPNSPDSDEIRPIPRQWEMGHHVINMEREANLLDYWRVLISRKWLILSVLFICVLASFLFTKLSTPKFTSEVTLLPITGSKGGGLSEMASQLSSVPLVGKSLGGLSEKFGDTKKKDLVNILKSRSISEKIINKFNLMPVIFSKQWDEKKQIFHPGFPSFLKPIPVLEDGVAIFRKKITKVKLDKKTDLLSIKVTMNSPILAAGVANAMVIELQDFINSNSLTEEKRNRIFIEEQMVKNRAKLLNSGKVLNQFYSTGKISSIKPKIDVNVGSYEKIAKSYEELRKEYENLGTDKQKQLREKINEMVPGVPGQVYLQYLTLNRHLLTKTHTLLTQQFEFAKIEESKEDLAFNVLDKAKVKIRASSPNLFLNLAVGTMLGLGMGFLLAFFLDYLKRIKGERSE